ncbi:MAG: hypothetical protein IT363_16165 [Methanoregulaceae archaeon]|nr:hypothetical protein [Methanoregulaceae archaeon]
MDEPFPLLHDPPSHEQRRTWIDRIPVIGGMVGYQRQIALEVSLVNQAIERGPVPESVWAPFTYDMNIRRTIERIVIDHAYPAGSTFHPLDPVELMFVLRYGDLNEVEILLAIEGELGFRVDDALMARLIAERMTFIEFIEMVEESPEPEQIPKGIS